MPKRLANSERIPRRALSYLLLVALIALGCSLVVRAQQQQQQPPPAAPGSTQQRPRRIGNGKTPAPAPQTPAPAAAATSEEVDEGDVVRVETQLVSVPAVVMDG